MNGVTFGSARRYQIGPMDLAILADCGIPLKGQKGEAKQGAALSAGAGLLPSIQLPFPRAASKRWRGFVPFP